MGDMQELPQWMSYADLARARGISRASATRLAQRRGWERRVGNDGLTKVAVPAGEELPTQHDAAAGDPDQGPTVEMLQAELTALAAELADERERRARAEGEAAGLRTALDGIAPALASSQREVQLAREDARNAREAVQVAREEAAFLRGQVAVGERGRAGQTLIEAGGYGDSGYGRGDAGYGRGEPGYVRSPSFLRWLLHRLSTPGPGR